MELGIWSLKRETELGAELGTWNLKRNSELGTSLKIQSLLSFCYFLIGTSNLSLKARCCYRRRLFLLSVFGICVTTYVYHLGYIYIPYACPPMYVLSHQHIGHGVFKEKAFRVYFKKSINLSCLSLETSANLVMSRAIFPYLVTRGRCKTRHMGSLQM